MSLPNAGAKANSRLYSWEESGPKGGREEYASLLSLGYHLPGD